MFVQGIGRELPRGRNGVTGGNRKERGARKILEFISDDYLFYEADPRKSLLRTIAPGSNDKDET